MAMENSYLEYIAEQGGELLDYIILVDEDGSTEIDRKEAGEDFEWEYTDGELRPDQDLEFDVSSGDEVAEWQVLDTDDSIQGSSSLPNESYDNDGTYTLVASDTGIIHTAS